MYKKNDYHEDIIVTPSVKRLEKALRILMHMLKPTIFAIIGVAGLGKTMSVNHFITQQQPQSHTGFLPSIKIIVPPKPTPRSLTTSILGVLGEKPRGRNAKELADQVMETLDRYDIRLLIFDEGDRLNDASFDMLRDIHDQSYRPIALVGLPRLMQVIERYEQFNSRVAVEIEFKPLDLDELKASFLPHLQFSRWSFDPDMDDDRAMAEYAWKRVSPSLRWLVNWIQVANAIAEVDGTEKITLETMKEASELVRLDRTNNQDNSDDRAGDSGWREGLSEMRKRAKNDPSQN